MSLHGKEALKFIQKPWVSNIVINLIYKDCISKKFFKDIDAYRFNTTMYTDVLYLEHQDKTFYPNKDDNFVLFNKALEFLYDLNGTGSINGLPEKYKRLNAFETMSKAGQIFRDPFYNYIFNHYLFARHVKRK